MNEDTMDSMRELIAQIAALQTGLTALIRSHPNPKNFRESLDFVESWMLANAQYDWSDEQITRYSQTIQSLRTQTSG